MDFSSIHTQVLHGIEVHCLLGDPQAPSVILFHGFGADALDLVSLSQAATGTLQKPNFYFPRGPLEIPFAHNYTGRAWFPINIDILRNAMHEGRSDDIVEAFPEFSQIRQICTHMIEELNIPLSKLFIGGFSQGAILATDIALNARENIAGLLIFSGTLVNEAHWGKMASKHKGLPFFQSHGKEDPLLPFNRAEALTNLFLQNSFYGSLHAFSGGHDIPHSTILKLNSFFKDHIK